MHTSGNFGFSLSGNEVRCCSAVNSMRNSLPSPAASPDGKISRSPSVASGISSYGRKSHAQPVIAISIKSSIVHEKFWFSFTLSASSFTFPLKFDLRP